MNSLKKALASLFVLATIFVVFSCSNASNSDDDGNPFKGTTWEGEVEGESMSLTFTTSNTCVYGYGVSSERAVSVDVDTYSYTWKENDDGSYTAILKIEDDDSGMTFTIDSSGAVSGTFTVDGHTFTFSKKVDGEIEIDTDGDGVPFAGTKWVGTGEAEGEEYSFGKTTVIENDASEFIYISKQTDEGYTASIGMYLAGEWKEIYTLTIESADAKEGVFDYQGFKVTYKRTK